MPSDRAIDRGFVFLARARVLGLPRRAPTRARIVGRRRPRRHCSRVTSLFCRLRATCGRRFVGAAARSNQSTKPHPECCPHHRLCSVHPTSSHNYRAIKDTEGSSPVRRLSLDSRNLCDLLSAGTFAVQLAQGYCANRAEFWEVGERGWAGSVEVPGSRMNLAAHRPRGGAVASSRTCVSSCSV